MPYIWFPCHVVVRFEVKLKINLVPLDLPRLKMQSITNFTRAWAKIPKSLWQRLTLWLKEKWPSSPCCSSLKFSLRNPSTNMEPRLTTSSFMFVVCSSLMISRYGERIGISYQEWGALQSWSPQNQGIKNPDLTVPTFYFQDREDKPPVPPLPITSTLYQFLEVLY